MLELTKELNNVVKSLEKLLEHIGSLYKFHGMKTLFIANDLPHTKCTSVARPLHFINIAACLLCVAINFSDYICSR